MAQAQVSLSELNENFAEFNSRALFMAESGDTWYREKTTEAQTNWQQCMALLKTQWKEMGNIVYDLSVPLQNFQRVTGDNIHFSAANNQQYRFVEISLRMLSIATEWRQFFWLFGTEWYLYLMNHTTRCANNYHPRPTAQ